MTWCTSSLFTISCLVSDGITCLFYTSAYCCCCCDLFVVILITTTSKIDTTNKGSISSGSLEFAGSPSMKWLLVCSSRQTRAISVGRFSKLRYFIRLVFQSNNRSIKPPKSLSNKFKPQKLFLPLLEPQITSWTSELLGSVHLKAPSIKPRYFHLVEIETVLLRQTEGTKRKTLIAKSLFAKEKEKEKSERTSKELDLNRLKCFIS